MHIDPADRKILVYQPVYVWLSVVVALVLLLSAGYFLFQSGVRYADTAWVQLEAQNEDLSQRLEQAHGVEEDLRQQLAIQQRSSEIDRLATTAVRKEFAVLQDSMLEMREELAFYRGIVSPQGGKAGLQVQRFQVRPVDASGRYTFELVLTQLKRNDRYARGTVSLELKGAKAGKAQSLALTDLLVDEPGSLKFKFRYFQEFSGDFELPEGFVPESVVIKVQPSGKGQPDGVEKTVEWPA